MEQWVGELSLVTSQGKPTPTLENFFLIRDVHGEPLYFADVVTDITQQKLAEETLRQSREELQAIYDGISDGLAIADIEQGRVIRVNATFCKMLGYSREELLSKPVAELHPASEWPRVTQSFQRMATGESPLTENCQVVRKDGSVFFADIPTSLVVYNGRRCAMGFFRDVTLRRQAEEALKTEHRVLRQLLKSHDHERKLIAYEIHDGIAQLLAGAVMQLQTHQRLLQVQPDEAPRSCAVAQQTLQRCLAEARRLINEVRMPLLDESGVVAAIENLVFENNGPTGPRIEFDAQVDFDRLEPVLENAVYRIVQEGLTNARRHSASERIRVELAQLDDCVRITVEDWGVGFDAEKATENTFGLEGIKERSRLLGGHATIETHPGRGTRIVAELPLAIAE